MGHGPGGGGAMGGWEKALGVAIGAVGLRKEALKRIKLGLVKIHCLALAFAPTQKSRIAMLRSTISHATKTKPGIPVA